MEFRHIGKRVTGFLVASSVAFAGMAFTNTAQAVPATDATIEIKVEHNALSSESFTAYLLGSYENEKYLWGNGPLESLKIAANTNATANGAILDIAKGLADADAGVDEKVPANWIASHWLGYAITNDEYGLNEDTKSAASPYAGILQRFAKQLAQSSAFTSNTEFKKETGSLSTAAGESFTIDGLKTGLYLITSTKADTLPMIVGTKSWDGFNFVDYEDVGGNKRELGVGVLKNEDIPYMWKEITNGENGFGIHDVVQYQITYPIPAIGTHSTDTSYAISIADVPGAGITFDESETVNSLSITAGKNPVELSKVDGITAAVTGGTFNLGGIEKLFIGGSSGAWTDLQKLTVDVIDWQGEPDTEIVDVSPGTLLYIRFTARVNNNAVSIDATQYPHNDAKAATNPDLAPNTATATLTQPGVNDPDDKDSATAYVFGINLKKVNKGNHKQTLEGAEFAIKRLKDDKDLNFDSIGSGEFELTWSGVSVPTSFSNGVFKITGLSAGKYEFTETKSPSGYYALDPFIVVIKPNWFTSIDHYKSGQIVDTLEYSVEDVADDTVWIGDLNTDTGKYQTVYVGDPESNVANLPYTGGIGIAIFLIVGICVTVVGIRAHRQSVKAETAATAI
ncbi:MAG: SpaA isopeptide-forming pilin-related protein [Bifidobacterium sp.]|uniref:SpaA isopeptide-forming pilin-related protein n=1 Tax=Bifidobacterium sp. TaxID=41200 RepID=UPI0039EBB490